MKKAILIDPYLATVETVLIEDYRDIQDAIYCSVFTTVQIDEKHTAFVDDEGLINGTSMGVVFRKDIYPQPLAGRVLILGNGPYGESADCKLTAQEVIEMTLGICEFQS